MLDNLIGAPSAVGGGVGYGAARVNVLSTASDGFPVYGCPTIDVLSKRQGERVVQGGGNENRESRMLHGDEE